jgi:hypothetical protein
MQYILSQHAFLPVQCQICIQRHDVRKVAMNESQPTLLSPRWSLGIALGVVYGNHLNICFKDTRRLSNNNRFESVYCRVERLGRSLGKNIETLSEFQFNLLRDPQRLTSLQCMNDTFGCFANSTYRVSGCIGFLFHQVHLLGSLKICDIIRLGVYGST